ncbi:DUF58 domain-containing protein [Virgibacillus sp. W0181]|uniref:DUF58 domain-containing protein n=1 Tax=Virgibacillus sp. W0181 TaxID=3391581 RepID=UPI003F44F0C9
MNADNEPTEEKAVQRKEKMGSGKTMRTNPNDSKQVIDAVDKQRTGEKGIRSKEGTSASRQASGLEENENVTPVKKTSILFEPLTIGCMLVLLVIAVWFKFLPLIVVFSFLLILSLFIIVWKKKALTKIELGLEVSKTRLFVGEELQANAQLKNNKWLPLIWLEWEFPASKQMTWGDTCQNTYVARFLSLLSYQQVNWTVKGQGNKRGVYDIGQVTVRSGDGFRFAEKEHVHTLNKTVFVYPELLPVRVPPFRPSMQWEIKGKKGGFLEDPLLINGIRDYEAGDDWRRFNWRASARKGKMQTNVYQPIISEQLFIVLDIQGFFIDEEKYANDEEKQHQYRLEKENSFEAFLSTIASFAVAYHEQEIHIGYTSNGLNQNKRKQRFVAPGSEITPVLDELAQLTQNVNRHVSPFADVSYHGGAVPVFIFCERILEAHYRWYEQYHQKMAIHFYYVYESKFSIKLHDHAKPIDDLLKSKGAESS